MYRTLLLLFLFFVGANAACEITPDSNGHVDIPAGTTTIGRYAYQDCTALISVTIPDGVTLIDQESFWGCTALTSVTIPTSVVRIGQSAFKKSGLTSITIPDSVTQLGHTAFRECTSLASVTIGNSVTSIGPYTFYETALTSVSIPDTVTSIGSSAFQNCNSLTSVVIPDGVISIGVHAFYWCTSLASVTIGNSVTSIGNDAFQNCNSLTSVVIPDGMISIGAYAFYKCSSLTSVTIPDSVTSLANNAFVNTHDDLVCTKTCPEGQESSDNTVTGKAGCTIAQIATLNCDTVCTDQEYDDGSGCQLLTVCTANQYESVAPAFPLAAPSPSCNGIDEQSVEIICTSGGFYWEITWEIKQLDGVSLINGVGGETKTACLPRETLTLFGTDSYGDGWNGASIKVVDAENGHVYFEEWLGPSTTDGKNTVAKELFIIPPTDPDDRPIADRECEVIRGPCAADEYESVVPIATSTNRVCTLISNWTPVCQAVVVIPNGVTTIPANAYEFCTALTSITIPDSVTSIGQYAFRETSLTSVDIPDSVTSIGNYAFFAAASLTTVSMPTSLESVGGQIFAMTGVTQQIILTILPDPDATDGRPTGTRLSFIHAGACPLLPGTEWISGGGIWGYADTADTDAYNAQHHAVTGHYSIPQGVTDIEDGAFRYCKLLTSVTIPSSVVRIGLRAFAWTGLTSVTIPESVETIGSAAFKSNALTSVTIPNSVTSIGTFAFRDCASLATVHLGNGLLSIGSSVFESCLSLTSVSIPDSVTSIGAWVFNNCTSLSSITIPDSVTSIGTFAFKGCTSLTSVTIPDSVTSIGASAFAGAASLVSAHIGDGVTSLGNGAFYECTSLNSVYLGKSLTAIEASSFALTGLTSVTIPNTVTSIGQSAFQQCSSLTTVHLGNGLLSIGSWAFGNTPITSINIPDSVTSLAADAFANADSTFLCNKRCTSDGQVAPVNTVPGTGGCTVATLNTLVCADCPDGTYNDDDSIVCSPKKDCPPGEYVDTHGSASADRVCKPCERSFSTETNVEYCTPHVACPYMVDVHGTSTSDAVCLDQYCCQEGSDGDKHTFDKYNQDTSEFWGIRHAPHTSVEALAYCKDKFPVNEDLPSSHYFYHGACDAPIVVHDYPPAQTVRFQGMDFPDVPSRNNDGGYCHDGAECVDYQCGWTKNAIKCAWQRNKCSGVDVCGAEPVCWELYNKWRDYNVNEWDCLNKDNCAGTFREHGVCCEAFTSTCYACKMCLAEEDYCMLPVQVREEPGGVPPGCTCASGTSSIAGDTYSPCLRCTVGWGNGVGGNTPCEPCPAGTANPIEAGTCDVCPYPTLSVAGSTECTNATVLSCGQGQKWTPPTNILDGTCEDCPAGSYGPSGASTTQEFCTTCPHGMYSIDANSTECIQCPDDQTTTTSGSTLAALCTDCDDDQDCRVRTTENGYTCRRERALAPATPTYTWYEYQQGSVYNADNWNINTTIVNAQTTPTEQECQDIAAAENASFTVLTPGEGLDFGCRRNAAGDAVTYLALYGETPWEDANGTDGPGSGQVLAFKDAYQATGNEVNLGCRSTTAPKDDTGKNWCEIADADQEAAGQNWDYCTVACPPGEEPVLNTDTGSAWYECTACTDGKKNNAYDDSACTVCGNGEFTDDKKTCTNCTATGAVTWTNTLTGHITNDACQVATCEAGYKLENHLYQLVTSGSSGNAITASECSTYASDSHPGEDYFPTGIGGAFPGGCFLHSNGIFYNAAGTSDCSSSNKCVQTGVGHKCTVCGAGEHSDEGSTVCTDDSADVNECTATQHFVEGTNHTTDDAECVDDATQQTDCVAGEYFVAGTASSTNDDSACSDCAANQYSAAGAASCTNDGKAAATDCGNDQYFTVGTSNTTDDGTCTDCTEPAANKYTTTTCGNTATDRTKDTVVGDCSAPGTGKYTSTACDHGDSATAGTNTQFTDCSSCTAGQYASLACAAGTKVLTGSDTTCSNCAAGTSSDAGATSCTNCAAGKTSTAGGSCSDCAAGKYATAGDDACTACADGQYSAAGAGSCTDHTSCHANRLTGASATAAGTCPACTGTTWADSDTNDCADHSTSCDSGKYISSAGTADADITCSDCSACTGSTYANGGCTGSTDTTCTAHSTCTGTTYASAAGTADADTTCTECTSACTGDTYETTACTASANRVCSACAAACNADCTGSNPCNYQTTACTPTTNRVCTHCCTDGIHTSWSSCTSNGQGGAFNC